jgi:hypothetical protein
MSKRDNSPKRTPISCESPQLLSIIDVTLQPDLLCWLWNMGFLMCNRLRETCKVFSNIFTLEKMKVTFTRIYRQLNYPASVHLSIYHRGIQLSEDRFYHIPSENGHSCIFSVSSSTETNWKYLKCQIPCFQQVHLVEETDLIWKRLQEKTTGIAINAEDLWLE